MSEGYNPRSWFWLVGGDTSRAWSSALGEYVTEWDAERTTRILNESELGDVLRPYGLVLPAPKMEDFAAAVQKHIDAVAVSRGYADGVALASYVTSDNAQWSAEATVFAKWRDGVWAYAYQQLAAVQSGARQAPSIAGLVLELPQIDWQAVPVTDLQIALERIAHLENALGEFVSRIESGT